MKNFIWYLGLILILVLIYVKTIWIYQWVHLSLLPCAWLTPPVVHHAGMLALSLHCTDFLLVCFYGSQFCSPAKNQTSFSQSKGCFSFLWRWQNCVWTGLQGLHINYTNMICIRRNVYHLQFLRKTFLNNQKIHLIR